MDKQELAEFIRDKINELYDKNEQEYGDNVVLPTVVAQIAVHATLATLEKLGLLNLPNFSPQNSPPNLTYSSLYVKIYS